MPTQYSLNAPFMLEDMSVWAVNIISAPFCRQCLRISMQRDVMRSTLYLLDGERFRRSMIVMQLNRIRFLLLVRMFFMHSFLMRRSPCRNTASIYV